MAETVYISFYLNKNMFPDKNRAALPPHSTVVGTIHSPNGLRQAFKLNSDHIDLLEIRVDAFADAPQQLLNSLSKLNLPLILTVRHPLEGAIQPLSASRRRELFLQFLQFAAFIDIELRSAKTFTPIIDAARARGIKVIFSHHDFKRTPTRKRLQELAGQAQQLGANLFKLATTTATPSDLATLLAFLADEKRIPLSVMGMGQFGKISRLLLAQSGSRLNYGFLDKAQVPGQWPAPLLKTRLSELTL